MVVGFCNIRVVWIVLLYPFLLESTVILFDSTFFLFDSNKFLFDSKNGDVVRFRCTVVERRAA